MPSEFADFRVQDLELLLPLTLLVVAGLRRESYRPRSELFDRQCWTYWDVVLLFAVLAATAFFGDLLNRFSLTPIAVVALALLLQAVVVLSIIYWLLRSKYRLPMSALGFDKNVLYHLAWPFTVVFAILALIGVCWSLLLFIDRPVAQLIALPGGPRPGSRLQALGLTSRSALGMTLLYYFDILLLMPIMEEILFRGFAYSPVFRRFGKWNAAIFTAVLWALGHRWGLPTALITLTGVLYAFLYQRTESLLPSLSFHVAGNTVITIGWLLSDLTHADRLVLPMTVASCILFVIFRSVRTRSKPARTTEAGHVAPS